MKNIDYNTNLGKSYDTDKYRDQIMDYHSLNTIKNEEKNQ
jgi:hypothetical protein